MLTRKQFKDLIGYYQKECKDMDEFDEALKKYAQSDFTGFYRDQVYDIIKLAESLMNDKYSYISWWLFDTNNQDPEYTKIWEEGEEEPSWDIRTLDDLYDYLLITYYQTPPKEQLDAIIKAQDNGVKFALKTINDLAKKNAQTGNKDWQERNAMFELVSSKIENEYLLLRGMTDLHSDENCPIISILNEES